MVIKVKEFSTREDLESYIQAEFGTDIEKNRDSGNSISGTKYELASLSLSDTSRVFGIKCVSEDIKTKDTSKHGKGNK